VSFDAFVALVAYLWNMSDSVPDALFYDVYTCLSEIHLAQLDMDISWSDVCVRTDDDERWGATRKYFTMPWYRMPIGQMAVAEA
jgi:protein arginine N-methyltransferase 2